MKTRILLMVGVVWLIVSITNLAPAGEPGRGKLKVHVSPEEAYTFLDGKAIGPHNRSMKISEGTHHLLVANYGYKFFEQDVMIVPGKTTSLDVKLETVGADVPGPKGSIQLELGRLSLKKAGDYAVLLTGKNPKYFVGHIDEFNNFIRNKQQLYVAPGTYQITIWKLDSEVWSGPISVEANQRVILNVSNGKKRDVSWPHNADLSRPMPRFKAGTATASVVVAPVTGEITASPSRIDCGEQSRLAWSSAESVDADISGMSPVPAVGERVVSPKQTTSYEFTASGPGGTVKSQAQVQVNNAVATEIGASPSEVHYQRVGDKIIRQESTVLRWSSSNADSVTISTLGTVDPKGTRDITLTPQKTADGSVDETVSYTITATNSCGGVLTRTAAVHVIGSIEGMPSLGLQSVFYPTAYPLKTDPTYGLLNSQRQQLTGIASDFKKYLAIDNNASLSLVAHADVRGPSSYNQALSLRRAELVRDFLVSQGVSADQIQISAVGKEEALTNDDVATLMEQNPNPAPKERSAQIATTRLAYQRRVDVILNPTKKESSRFFPNAAGDSEIIWRRSVPPLKEVQSNQ